LSAHTPVSTYKITKGEFALSSTFGLMRACHSLLNTFSPIKISL